MFFWRKRCLAAYGIARGLFGSLRDSAREPAELSEECLAAYGSVKVMLGSLYNSAKDV